MYDKNTILARGMYRHNQHSSFVCVREFMFVRKKEKKCLVLRFLNETDATLNTVEYTLKQLDIDGKVVDSSVITHSNLRAVSGKTFSPRTALVLKDECVDFRVEIIKATSGLYTYHLRGECVVVDYGIDDLSHTPHNKERSDYSVTPRKNYKPGRRTGWALVLIFLGCVLAIALNVCQELYYAYKDGTSDFDFWGLLSEEDFEEDDLDSDA